jgi:pyruvate dehydrogenase E1 component alpha subunit
MSSDATLQLLTPDGNLVTDDRTSEYLPWIEKLDHEQLLDFHRHMVVMRRFDTEAGNLQRQGQLALWIPSVGQEAAQVGSAFAAAPQDHLFPAYREHVVGRVRGLDLMRIIEMLRGLSHGGWVPSDTGNFHLYTLVIGSQTLHATGYAMGMTLDGSSGTGDPDVDAAVLVYFGDGASSQGDVNEAMIFAASYQTPQVFFLQNNHWAISVPVERQSRTPLYLRGEGFGIPSVQIDGNDVLASYAVTAAGLLEARSGRGPRFIEALTYRMGAHTSSDDPTKYRENDEVAYWGARDPIVRFEAYLRGIGVGDDFFAEVATEASDLASDMRTRTLALQDPPTSKIFAHVYTDPHPLMDAQRSWLADYEASFEGDDGAIAEGGAA